MGQQFVLNGRRERSEVGLERGIEE